MLNLANLFIDENNTTEECHIIIMNVSHSLTRGYDLNYIKTCFTQEQETIDFTNNNIYDRFDKSYSDEFFCVKIKSTYDHKKKGLNMLYDPFMKFLKICKIIDMENNYIHTRQNLSSVGEVFYYKKFSNPDAKDVVRQYA